MTSTQEFLPAAGRLPLAWYDRGLAVTMRETVWRPLVTREVAAHVPEHGDALEIGAGTGSLTLALRAALPADTRLAAVDPDADALAMAQRKLGGAAVDWLQGQAEALPVADDSQDAVAIALVLHHLSPAGKHAALAEAHRVLRPGGTLVVADFGPPQDPLMRLAFGVIRLVDGRETTAGHPAGIVARTVRASGFAPPVTVRRLRTPGGTLEVLRATAA